MEKTFGYILPTTVFFTHVYLFSALVLGWTASYSELCPGLTFGMTLHLVWSLQNMWLQQLCGQKEQSEGQAVLWLHEAQLQQLQRGSSCRVTGRGTRLL